MLHSRSYLHPFPARMAPNIALEEIERFDAGSIIVDPMVGSGTVAMTAVAAGHQFYGFDLDPLAALIAQVSTSCLDYDRVRGLFETIIRQARLNSATPADLPWVEVEDETHKFIGFWFADKQKRALSGIAVELDRLHQSEPSKEVDALKIALSRIIVTKESKASLARDTSHSRPHRVAKTSDYDVFKGFEQSVTQMLQRHSKLKIDGNATIQRGDARKIDSIGDGFCDAIVSSPPYLNAIDYLRGHKLSLVWLGFTIPQIRQLRSMSVGAERATTKSVEMVSKVLAGFGDISNLAPRQKAMISRYAIDLHRLSKEAERILKPNGTALYVMGNSCLKGVYIDNASALANAAELVGLTLLDRSEREIPLGSRYLPTPKENNALASRMRKEIVLKFQKVAFSS
ncbi:site-specific DNA-methyltransferase [Sneathiella sp. HT1-7]|uniref:site-specific DNA-methyltransferase n=1 Tax=Sneathiella sp. HT1-7 TaxID=2887192 RepID=UPI001D14C630|nr:site-specific DNA-methyltransferase [Sneathiella sp. HT1-7]MCC3305107.1 site-specific DNA-methyltransferase [Sneathiella sp. HT1-7]